MKRIYKKEEGVSPVIATILMVAITVVLAATVWLLVSGYMGGGTNTPLTMSLTYNAQMSTGQKAVFDVSMSQPSQATFSNVKITLENNTGKDTQTLSNDGTGTFTLSSGSHSYTVTISINDLNGNGKLDTGDQIIVEVTSGTVAGMTLYVYITGYSGNAQATVPS